MEIAKHPKALFDTIAQNEHDRRLLEEQRKDIERKLAKLTASTESLTPFIRAYLEKLPLTDSVVTAEAREHVTHNLQREEQILVYKYQIGMLSYKVWARPVCCLDNMNSMPDSEINSIMENSFKEKKGAK